MASSPARALSDLRRLRRMAASTRAEYEAQIERCFEVGCRTFDIADAIGTTSQAVSVRRRRWRERRLMAEAVE